MENINNYKCIACGGGVRFDPKSGNVVCEYCDTVYSIEEIEKHYGVSETSEKDSSESKSDSVQNEGFDSQDTKWDTQNLSEDWGEDSSKMKEYSCPSCGATIICEKTTAATSCPYCDNPTVIEKQFSGSLKPDYVIPFKIDKKGAIRALKEHYKEKTLIPKEFSDENHLEEIKGIYVPFWFFSGTTQGSVTFKTTKDSRKRSGEQETITSRHFECLRKGSLDFKMVPIDASEKMPDDMMDSLEPFDYNELKPFSTAYLPGYLADKYDVKFEDCIERADKRCVQTFIDELKSTVVGYDSVNVKENSVTLKNGIVNYGFLPVYLLYTKWNDSRFLFAVNGQTGKVVGKLPCCKKRSFLFVLINTVVASIVIYIIARIVLFFLKCLVR